MKFTQVTASIKHGNSLSPILPHPIPNLPTVCPLFEATVLLHWPDKGDMSAQRKKRSDAAVFHSLCSDRFGVQLRKHLQRHFYTSGLWASMTKKKEKKRRTDSLQMSLFCSVWQSCQFLSKLIVVLDVFKTGCKTKFMSVSSRLTVIICSLGSNPLTGDKGQSSQN